MNSFLEKISPVVFLLARVVVAYLFLLHGTAKFFEFPMSMTNGNGSVPFFSLMGIGALIEIVGGVLIILGLFTRLTAFILSGQMAVAYFMFHATPDTWLLPLLNGGELAALYSVVFLLFAVIGAGKISLDYTLRGKI